MIWFWMHLVFIVLGLMALAVAVLSAGIYLLQSAQLKSKHPGQLFLKLPSLDSLDKIHFRSLALGVLLFSIGISIGFFWAKNLSALTAIFSDVRATLSILTCFLYWIILVLRASAIRRGQKIAVGSLLAFFLLSIAVTSSYVAPSAIHGP